MVHVAVLKEKYEVYTHSLKEQLVKQTTITEQAVEEVTSYKLINDELNEKVIRLQSKIVDAEKYGDSEIRRLFDRKNEQKMSIFEADSTAESSKATSPDPELAEDLVVKSVSLLDSPENGGDRKEMDRLKARLKKASKNMGILKQKYTQV